MTRLVHSPYYRERRQAGRAKCQRGGSQVARGGRHISITGKVIGRCPHQCPHLQYTPFSNLNADGAHLLTSRGSQSLGPVNIFEFCAGLAY